MTQQEHLEAFDNVDEQEDFAGEHETPAVDHDVVAKGNDGESESPEGWDGLSEE
jgi:hypothetical protein